MKFRLLTLALLCCGAAATAQNPYIALEGAAESAAGIAVSMPRSVLAVDLSVECSTVLCGPYARYAQKYLGVRAPLTDKTTWSIAGARIALAGDDAFGAAAPAADASRVVSHAASDEAFAALQPDKTSATVYSLEDAARMAAEQIFSLRRHRLELITGEAGENVLRRGAESRAGRDRTARAELPGAVPRQADRFGPARSVTWSIPPPTGNSMSSAASARPPGCFPRAISRAIWWCCRSSRRATRSVRSRPVRKSKVR